MWALRRASSPFKSQVFGLGIARACCSELEVSRGCVESEAVIRLAPKAVNDVGLTFWRFYHQTRDCSNIFSGRRGLLSQAGAESSGEEDDLETPDSIDAAKDENEDGLISESELSGHHDDIEDPAQNDLESSEIETDSSGKMMEPSNPSTISD